MVQQAQQAQKTRIGFEDKHYSGKREQIANEEFVRIRVDSAVKLLKHAEKDNRVILEPVNGLWLTQARRTDMQRNIGKYRNEDAAIEAAEDWMQRNPAGMNGGGVQ